LAGEQIFDWDEDNIEHVARHGVRAEEAEQVLENDPLELNPQFIKGEERFPNIGVTNNGRWLVVVVTQRGMMARIITAYPANNKMVELYVRNKTGSYDR
jgi:uncharacterized protein